MRRGSLFWLILVMVLISAPLSYFIREEARQAMYRRAMRKSFVRFKINVEAFQENAAKGAKALQAFGQVADRAAFDMAKFKNVDKRGL